MKNQNTETIGFLTGIIMVIIFIIDLFLPLGVAGAIPYVLVVLMTVWLPKKTYTYAAGVITTFLTIVGLYLSQPNSELWLVLLNRFLAILGIWIAVAAAIQYRKSNKQLAILNSELEQRVSERTEEVRESHELHSLIARNFPNGTICVLDKKLNYIFAEGQEFYRYGITSEKLMGQNYIERLSDDIRETAKEKLIEALNGKTTTLSLENKGNYYRLQATPLFDSQKGINRILVVEINVTKEKIGELELQKTIAKEQELNELKTRFVSMASHEFRTPLATIASSASLIEKYKEREAYDRMDKHIKRIRSSVNNLTSILNDFLSTDKMESGKISIHKENMDLKELLSKIQNEMQEQAKDGQTVHLEYNSDKSEFHLDRMLIRNILINLMSNAIKYSDLDKNIFIICSSDNEKIEIQVKDEGMGIPDKDQKHMFERFFRAGNSTNIEGTGLGLNIVTKYLQLMNGEISFESKEGVGTTFIVSIPLHD